jgi:hypothetical protein
VIWGVGVGGVSAYVLVSRFSSTAPTQVREWCALWLEPLGSDYSGGVVESSGPLATAQTRNAVGFALSRASNLQSAASSGT